MHTHVPLVPEHDGVGVFATVCMKESDDPDSPHFSSCLRDMSNHPFDTYAAAQLIKRKATLEGIGKFLFPVDGKQSTDQSILIPT